MIAEKKILLAFGEEALTEAVSEALQKAGFQVSTLKKEKTPHLPKAKFDCLVQLGCDPHPLTEGTRQLLEKAKNDGAKFVLISSLRVLGKPPATCEETCLESLHFAEALTREFHQKHGVSTTILRLPIIYGPGVPLSKAGALGELLTEFAADQTTNPVLTLYGGGKENRYYLFLTDAANAVKIAITTSGSAGAVYHALPSTSISSATIAELLNKTGGNRHTIRHHKGLVPIEKEFRPSEMGSEPLPKFTPKISLKEGILHTLTALSSSRGSQKKLHLIQRVLESRYTPHLPPQLTLRKPLLSPKAAIRMAVILLFLSPFLYLGAQTASAAHHLLQLRQHFTAFDFRKAQASAEAARAHFTAIDRFLGAIPLVEKTPLQTLVFASQGGEEAAIALGKLAKEGETFLTLVENLLQSRRGEEPRPQTEEEFNRLASAFREGGENLLTCRLHLTQVGPPFNRWLAPLLDYLQEGVTALKLGESFASAASDLLGYYGTRDYLILLQNSAEARAGGGFLGSLAQLTLENGGIKTLEVFDSYQFDSAGTFTPRNSQQSLNLRESNFYASFPESAQAIAHLFEKAQGVKVDGVIGTNLLLAKELIRLSGPLTLSSSDRTIDADNLFEVTTEEVEKEFFPGSSKKERFLQSLGEALLDKLFTLGRSDYTQLAKIGWEGLKRRDILLFFRDGNITQTLAETGFDGRVKGTSGDFLMVIDSNYGSKANAWIERSIDYKVFNPDRSDDLQGKLTIKWIHHGTQAWPAGVYGNFLRVLVPKGSILTEAFIDDKDVLSGITVTEEAGKTEFAAVLSVAPQTTATLRLSYRLPPALNLKGLTEYSLYVQKQPGTVGDAFSFAFEKPFGKRAAAKGLRDNGNSLTFEGNLSRDLALDITIEE